MKKTKNNSILTIISVICLLICLFCLAVVGTNSWFTSQTDDKGLKVQISVTLSNLNLAVYQVISGSEYKLNTFEEAATSGGYDYVDLSNDGEITRILPDTDYSLNLILKDADNGTESMYLRYKVEFVVNYFDTSSQKVTYKTLTPTLTGYTTNASSNGFVLNADGYYYYQDTGGENILLENTGSSSLSLMTGFSIDYAQFYNSENFSFLSGSSLKLLLTIECSDTTSIWS